MSRLSSTRCNLRLRVAKCLGIMESQLLVQEPPRLMCRSKLACLCLIKTWVFRDGVVKLSKGNQSKDEYHQVKIKGDIINESHLESVLDKERHEFELKEERYNVYNGKFKFDENHGTTSLVLNEFEERLLAFLAANNCGITICRIGSSIHIYFTDDHEESHVLQQCSHVEYEGNIDVKNIDEIITFKKYTAYVDSKLIVKELRNIREHMRNYSDSIGEDVNIIDIVKSDGGPINIYSCLKSDFYGFVRKDLVTLLRTSHVTLQKSGNCVRFQNIVFVNEKMESPYIRYNLPEGARILQAIADGRYRKAVLRFEDGGKEKENEDSEDYHEINLCTKGSRSNWTWLETNEAAMLDFLSIPATVAPQEFDVYACCGNILELKNGRVRAEGMTVIPGGNNFLSLSKRCLGIDTRMNAEAQIPMKHLDAADSFFSFFNANNELEYSPESVRLLCEAFHALDGLEMKPWGET